MLFYVRGMEQHRHTSQRDRLLALLKDRAPDWVPISEVLDIAGYQYGSRVLELRRSGHRIENDPGRAFRLLACPTSTAPDSNLAIDQQPQGSPPILESLFGDLSLDRSYKE